MSGIIITSADLHIKCAINFVLDNPKCNVTTGKVFYGCQCQPPLQSLNVNQQIVMPLLIRVEKKDT